ncbi:MAG: transposase [Candidatus Sedimenticola sp. (ex Thyasira tokunagai)]
MANCNQTILEFPALKRRKVQAKFSGGEITSDGGALLLRQIDQRLGLMKAVDAVIPDPRNPDYITHSQLSLLRQRVYGLSLGYEDLRCQPWRAKRGLVIPGSREDALLTRRARSAPEGKQSRHPNTASSHWELTAKR